MHYILERLFLVLVHYFFLVNYQPLIWTYVYKYMKFRHKNRFKIQTLLSDKPASIILYTDINQYIVLVLNSSSTCQSITLSTCTSVLLLITGRKTCASHCCKCIGQIQMFDICKHLFVGQELGPGKTKVGGILGEQASSLKEKLL